MLVAAPVVAALKVVLGHLWRVYVLGEPPDDLEEPARDVDGRERSPASSRRSAGEHLDPPRTSQ